MQENDNSQPPITDRKEHKPKGKEQRKSLIVKYLKQNYSVQEIATKLNVHESTVYREMEAMYEESKIWFQDLADRSFIYDYHKTIQVLEETISNSYKDLEDLEKRTKRLREMNEDILKTVPEKKPGTSAILLQNLNSVEATYRNTKQNYYKLIEDCTRKKANLLNKGPRIYAVEQLLRKAKADNFKPKEMDSLNVKGELELIGSEDLNNENEEGDV